MKRIKIAFLLLAVVFAVSSAFVSKQTSPSNSVLSQAWFVYDETPNDETNPVRYTYLPGQTPSCSDEIALCEVLVTIDEETMGGGTEDYKPLQSALITIDNNGGFDEPKTVGSFETKFHE